MLKEISVCLIALCLTACLSSTHYAPVVDAWQTPAGQASTYRVKKGDTLYSIAWAFGLDYRTLAAANHLRPPYTIEPGQRLKMRSAPTRAPQSRPGMARRERASAPARVLSTKPVAHWRWPARGRIVERFSTALGGNHGINITGRFGEPVRASASGVVVYSGDGLRGYGNLLIIKHNDSYLSAYAYNKKRLVRLGERVKAGQVIAEMGRDNAGRVLLHFEIRRNGRPVNPLRYLK